MSAETVGFGPLTVAATLTRPFLRTGKQIETRIFGTKGMMTYGGDDSDPSSGKLEVTLLDGSTTDTPEFLFEDTAEEGIGPASISAFIDGCLGRDYL